MSFAILEIKGIFFGVGGEDTGTLNLTKHSSTSLFSSKEKCCLRCFLQRLMVFHNSGLKKAKLLFFKTR